MGSAIPAAESVVLTSEIWAVWEVLIKMERQMLRMHFNTAGSWESEIVFFPCWQPLYVNL